MRGVTDMLETKTAHSLVKDLKSKKERPIGRRYGKLGVLFGAVVLFQHQSC